MKLHYLLSTKSRISERFNMKMDRDQAVYYGYREILKQIVVKNDSFSISQILFESLTNRRDGLIKKSVTVVISYLNEIDCSVPRVKDFEVSIDDDLVWMSAPASNILFRIRHTINTNLKKSPYVQ